MGSQKRPADLPQETGGPYVSVKVNPVDAARYRAAAKALDELREEESRRIKPAPIYRDHQV